MSAWWIAVEIGRWGVSIDLKGVTTWRHGKTRGPCFGIVVGRRDP